MMEPRSVAEQLLLELPTFRWHENDCWTAIVEFYKRWNGTVLPSYAYNCTTTMPPDKAYQEWYEVAESKALPGDLVLYKIGVDLHIGIYIGEGEFFHMGEGNLRAGRIGSVDRFRKHLWGFARYKGLAS